MTAPTIQVTIDVADFALGHPVPGLAFAVFARAAVDSSGTTIITSAPESVRLVGGTGTVGLEAGQPYQVRFYGVAGLPDPFYAAAAADCTAAELRQSHQLDPATLNPAAPVPQGIAAQVAALTGTVAGLQQELDGGSGIPDLALTFENGLV